MSLQTTLLIIIAVAIAGCSKPPEQAVATPTNYDVVLVPTEDFPPFEATKVASTVARDTGLQIKVVLPLGTRDWKPYPDRPQYDPDALRNLALPAIERLKPNYGGKVYVILTSRDIAPADKSLNFVFTQHDHSQKVSVVSAARMLFDQQGKQATINVIQTRLRKMLLRTIALQYYGLQRSTDIADVTYSPLMSVGDLDQMGLKLNKTK
jgi:predicted Zn-dependent protease